MSTGIFNFTESASTYFIADIAANHDGDLDRAKELIKLAAQAGANAAKFQNFRAESIVSRRGFDELNGKLAHQANWDKSVFEIYKDAELPIEWTNELIAECEKWKIDYFTAPYDLEFIDFFGDRMPFFKIGSGDITWKESLEKIGSKNKPVLLATGASNFEDVEAAVSILTNYEVPLVVMQCNTNYSGSMDNFEHLNLNVLKLFKEKFPKCGLGLSDHTPGYVAVLGAVALGARFIEKHFTDDKNRKGPDHCFSLDFNDWQEMVESTRLLEKSLGNSNKKVEDNEIESQVVQRRALRFSKNKKTGDIIQQEDLMALRPIPKNGISPMLIDAVVGRKLRKNVEIDELVTWEIIH